MNSLSQQLGYSPSVPVLDQGRLARHAVRQPDHRDGGRASDRPVETVTTLLSASDRLRGMIDPSIWLNLDLVAPKMALTSENGAALEHVLFAAVDSLAKNAKQPRNVTIRVRKLDHKALVLIAHDGAQTGSVSSAGHYAPLVRLAIAELMPVQFRHFGKLEVIAITANLSAAKRPKAGHRGKFNKETDNEDQ